MFSSHLQQELVEVSVARRNFCFNGRDDFFLPAFAV
jgi:hypothetical protein